MTAIAVDSHDDATPGRGRTPASPHRVAVIIIAALALGVAVGRFIRTPDAPPRRRPTAAAPHRRCRPGGVARFEQATLANPDDARAWQQLAIASVQAVADGEPLALYNRAAGASTTPNSSRPVIA